MTPIAIAPETNIYTSMLTVFCFFKSVNIHQYLSISVNISIPKG